MNHHLFRFLFALGAAVLLWVGAGFVNGHLLALCVTLLIAAVYGYGTLELARFRRGTAQLHQALLNIPEGLADLQTWLAPLPAALHNPVRQRIEGERSLLPGPALTPYLVGLLVMLGMLGTFLGMVVTLNGAVFALEGTPDLAAIRAAFATPIRGLGLAFGTSVAGVATSAVLGLLSALSRRERAACSQLLDSRIATTLRPFSHAHQRQAAYQALQAQTQALPQVLGQVQQLMEQMQAMGERMHAQLLAQQQGFHAEVGVAYTALAASVERSLSEALAHSAQAASQSLQPVLHTALEGLAAESRSLHERMVAATQSQTTQLLATTQSQTEQMLQATQARSEALLSAAQTQAEQLATATQARSEQLLGATHAHIQGLATQLQADEQQRQQAWASAMDTLLAKADAQQQQRQAQDAAWAQAQAARADATLALLQAELRQLRDADAARSEAAVARLAALQDAVAQHLADLGLALEAPIGRLIETASEAPRAAAEVIGQLRQQVSSNVERDNALLEERSRILRTLHTLLDGIQHASTEQRAVIDSLVATSAVALEQAGGQFVERVAGEASKLADIAASVTSSAVDVSSLSEAFGFAVQAFNASNEKLLAGLQRIEGELDKSMARSDEQLAYYVAQAREVIDLSIGAQKGIVDELRQLATQQAQLAHEAA